MSDVHTFTVNRIIRYVKELKYELGRNNFKDYKTNELDEIREHLGKALQVIDDHTAEQEILKAEKTFKED